MSFFDDKNPFVKMFEELSDESKEQYKKEGHYMYNIVDFETNQVIDKNVPDVEFKSILDALHSGLSIDDLTDRDRDLIRLHCGELANWNGGI